MASGMKLRLSLFGESHGEAVGITAEGLPPGFAPDLERLSAFLRRRTAKSDGFTTERLEEDQPEILSGFYRGKTTGTPLTVIFPNRNVNSSDYGFVEDMPRPGHADYPAVVQSKGHEDLRGGGFHSGRLTLPYTFVGGLCMQLLEEQGIQIAAHLLSIGQIEDEGIDAVHPDMERLRACHSKPLPVMNSTAEARMEELLRKIAAAGNSIGAIVECVAVGLPVGLGLPFFGSVESLLSSALFSIPAVKAVGFGKGFACAQMIGSQFNDPYRYDEERIVCEKNDNGGALGGMSNGMPLLFSVAFRPTPSIALPQQTVSYSEKRDQELKLSGRHDPCCAIRAVPVVESAVAITLTDLILMQGKLS